MTVSIAGRYTPSLPGIESDVREAIADVFADIKCNKDHGTIPATCLVLGSLDMVVLQCEKRHVETVAQVLRETMAGISHDRDLPACAELAID